MAIGRALSEPDLWQYDLGILVKTARLEKWKEWMWIGTEKVALVKLIVT